MLKRSGTISLVILLLGILLFSFRAFSSIFLYGFLEFIIGGYSILIVLVISLLLIIGSLFYIGFAWQNERYSVFLPLLSSIIVIILYFSALPGRMFTGYQKNFFERNYKQYQQAALIMVKTNLVKDREEYMLPFKYRHLSENGKVDIVNINNQINIIFPLRGGVGSGEFLVYTPIDKTIFENDKNFTVTKKKKNWYYVEEY